MPQQKQNLLYVLDAFSHRDIKRWKEQSQAISAYCWDHYSYFAHHRSLMGNELKTSLINNCIEYEFSNWHRAVDYKFSNEPLSARGSILNEVGGRFNIGDIDQIKFPKFAGLYFAVDVMTALSEKFGINSENAADGLTPNQLNLAGNLTIVKVKGKLTNVLNLCDPETISDFFKLIKNIHIPLSFIARAKKLGISAMMPVHNTQELLNTFLRDDWRVMPMQFDIPANPQILGQLVFAAGIEAILYPSVKTKKECLVVYPENFRLSDAYVEVDGDVPSRLIHSRIDSASYANFL